MTKSCTEDYRALDVRKINRAGRLKPGSVCTWEWSRHGQTIASIRLRAGFDRVTLDYRQKTHGGDWQDVAYPVNLDYSPCNLGGQRVWWQCPARGCGRRVAVLYGGAGVFACRHCYRLAYRSQRDNNAFGPADKLRDRLGWVPGIAHPPGDKPKGMHWRTYHRLMQQYELYLGRAVADTSMRLGRLTGRLVKIKL